MTFPCPELADAAYDLGAKLRQSLAAGLLAFVFTGGHSAVLLHPAQAQQLDFGIPQLNFRAGIQVRTQRFREANGAPSLQWWDRRLVSAPPAGTSRFHRMAAYTRCLRCAGAPRRPAGGSGLSLSIPS